MKYLFMLLLLMSCNAKTTQDVVDGKGELVKYYDKPNGVVCYRVRNFDGIHCFKGNNE